MRADRQIKRQRKGGDGYEKGDRGFIGSVGCFMHLRGRGGAGYGKRGGAYTDDEGGRIGQAVIIPESCEYIGSRAFADCPDLLYVSYPASATVEDDAFDGSNVRVRDEYEVQ